MTRFEDPRPILPPCPPSVPHPDPEKERLEALENLRIMDTAPEEVFDEIVDLARLIFLELQQRYPGKFTDGQLRTLQRRVKEWRLKQSTFVANEINQTKSSAHDNEATSRLR